MAKNEEIVVVGAGLVGTMCAVMLAQRGHSVSLFEGRPDWRRRNDDDGGDQHKNAIKRSINLALSHRGQEALKSIGALDEAMKMTIPMYRRAIHSQAASGDADSFQPYDEVDASNCIYSVSREGLNNQLLDQAESLGVNVCFGHKLTHIDRNDIAHFENDPAKFQGMSTYNDYAPGSVQVAARLIIGADGAYSGVRESLLRKTPMNFTRKYITHGYKEMNIPPTADGEFAMADHEALHIWPRGEFMMIGLPNPDKSFTCTIFAPFHQDGGVPGLDDLRDDPEAIKAYFQKHFPDAIPLMPTYVEDFQRNPACRLVTVRADPWAYKDKIVIMGDAAHAMVPFYGQGMNSGFEDVLFFKECLEQFKGDLSKAVPYFAKERRAKGNAIGQLSMQNYVEMRDHTASRLFLLRKKLEGALNWAFPNTWIPLYKMVAFTRVPYDEAIVRAERQDLMLKWAARAMVAASAGVAAAGLLSIKPAGEDETLWSKALGGISNLATSWRK